MKETDWRAMPFHYFAAWDLQSADAIIVRARDLGLAARATQCADHPDHRMARPTAHRRDRRYDVQDFHNRSTVGLAAHKRPANSTIIGA